MVRIACAGGFLGAGKTTALIAAAQKLIARGQKVGIVTNDQGSHLVDTALAQSRGLLADEITGGCFCCRFPEFVRHASRLVEQHQPDIILAEAVGSCTDLAATVYKPLRRFHADEFTLAPLSVFVEPDRIREMFGFSGQFDGNVRYLFEKQLSEAELIVLSKCDLLSPAEIEDCREQLRELLGTIPMIAMSAKTGLGLNQWVDQLACGISPGDRELDLDYGIYGQAEASLGWLNATVDLASDKEFSPADFGETLVAEVRQECRRSESAIAHLKILLVTTEESDRISLTSTMNQASWDNDGNLPAVREASVIINGRVSTSPAALRRMVEEALQSAARRQGVVATIQDVESFAPAPPQRPSF